MTEFAWEGALPPPTELAQSGIYGVTCDFCPPPAPVDDPLAKYLGADAIPGLKTDEDIAKFAREATLTRIHLRYTKDSLTDDLVFKAAEPMAGGIPEVTKTAAAKENRFQGRYIVRHPFDQNQCYRYYGGAMGGRAVMPVQTALSGTQGKTAQNTKLTAPFLTYLKSDVPELGLLAPKKK